MEPITHVLTGACLARAGLNRRAAYTTAAMAIAAEFPDVDTLWGLRGSVSGFEHHRGITHSFVGLPFEAALILAFFVALHTWRGRRALAAEATPHSRSKPLTAVPPRWPALYGALLIALASHLLLDYTNNYGLRPFLPFNPHWYAASIVFIFDPLIFLVLLGGLLLPSLFGLVAQEVGSKRALFRGAGWARAALVCIVALWCARAYEHNQAVDLADAQTLRAPADIAAPQTAGSDTASGADLPEPPRPLLQAQRASASPDPLSIFRWYTATDFGPVYQLGTANTGASALSAGPVLGKPARSPAIIAAENSHLGRVYLDWSSMPWFSIVSASSASGASESQSEEAVVFEDLRFMGSSPLLHREGQIPLTGQVVVNRFGQVLEEGMDGRVQR